ncbi:hypothetical protein A3F03_04205 [Candidatus Roizmanbacteria bacterium RIFCSPHIGHO2_12_FULL_41_11]|uniref:LytR/CpsA/Psr regulator C-terminal domain-containing protein n=2 Tax=Candidatus Roizmaniibacteriota TaxID=1752723 RepID=A0A1F7J5X5_9BACT|nr:MAG: hypothetical protein A3F03_04205 [Candidatus Roizmanbacteria bacterium RIFCSPHIGHO2_12_FULL_41_11]OGK51010.1 MAG: hypothetical protein A2966_02780 [Candidatus Roizmanbacteria bacterium RIFCSPLOWO2_01_FULL_41_22]
MAFMHQLEAGNRWRNRAIYIIFMVFFVAYFLYHLLKNFSHSLFFSKKDRLNFVIYGPYTAIYSLGLQDDQNYVIPFSPDFHIDVPGNYGDYRIGSLGKLAKLDNKPELLQKAFSYAASTLVDYYFYDNTDNLYYDLPKFAKGDIKLDVFKVLFFRSNTSIFDRLYLTLIISQKDKDKFRIFNSMTYKNQEEFSKNVLGLFYQKVFRTEKKNLQIIYGQNYHTANMINNLLEGSGVRVSDINLSTSQIKPDEACVIVEEGKAFSLTAQSLAAFFGCQLKRSNPEVYDILFILNNTENEWNIQNL